MGQNIEFIDINDVGVSEITRILNQNNISYFSYGIQKKSEAVKAFFTHHEWAKIYFRDNLFELDPLVDAARMLKNSIFPWEMIPINLSAQKVVMDERLECCGLKSGITFSSSSPSHFEIVAVGFSKKNTKSIETTQKVISQVIPFLPRELS